VRIGELFEGGVEFREGASIDDGGGMRRPSGAPNKRGETAQPSTQFRRGVGHRGTLTRSGKRVNTVLDG